MECSCLIISSVIYISLVDFRRSAIHQFVCPIAASITQFIPSLGSYLPSSPEKGISRLARASVGIDKNLTVLDYPDDRISTSLNNRGCHTSTWSERGKECQGIYQRDAGHRQAVATVPFLLFAVEVLLTSRWL